MTPAKGICLATEPLVGEFTSYRGWFLLTLTDWLNQKLTPMARLREGMAPHSSTLAWKIPWTEESGRLWSMGLLRVRQDWVTSLSLFTFTHWRRKWQPTPLFLPGESQGWGSLVGWRLWGRTESNTTEVMAVTWQGYYGTSLVLIFDSFKILIS